MLLGEYREFCSSGSQSFAPIRGLELLLPGLTGKKKSDWSPLKMIPGHGTSINCCSICFLECCYLEYVGFFSNQSALFFNFHVVLTTVCKAIKPSRIFKFSKSESATLNVTSDSDWKSARIQTCEDVFKICSDAPAPATHSVMTTTCPLHSAFWTHVHESHRRLTGPLVETKLATSYWN